MTTTSPPPSLSSWGAPGVLRLLFRLGSIGAILLSVLVGSFLAGVPRRLGFYRWLAYDVVGPPHRLVGLSPAFHEGVPYGYTYEALDREVDLSGQRVIVTGGNSGVGYAAAARLASRGASVVIACRNATRCRVAADTISSENSSAPAVVPMELDTSSFGSVKSFAADYGTRYPKGGLDVLMLNAGIGMGNGTVSVDGVELVFATNHAGHQLLYELLLPKLLESGRMAEEAASSSSRDASKPNGKGGEGARVVLTTSSGHYMAPNSFGVGLTREQLLEAGPRLFYAQSKLAQVLFAQEATRRLSNLAAEGKKGASRVFVNCAHVGVVDTNIWDSVVTELRRRGGLLRRALCALVQPLRSNFMWTADEGALTLVFLAASPNVTRGNGIRGRYFHPQAHEAEPHPVHAKNHTLQRELWDFTESLYRQ